MIDLLKKINEERVVIELVKGELKLFSSKTHINSDLLSEIRKHKKELIEYLNKNTKFKIEEKKYSEIPICVKQKSYQLSNAQYRLWIASQLQENSIAYNISNQIILDESYDMDCFKKAIHAVINHHEILRTVFKSNDEGEVRQYVLSIEELNFSIDYKDFREVENRKEAIAKYTLHDDSEIFDLSKGPLIRAGLLELPYNKYVFYYNMHHIISDGWSMDILSKDVMRYYQAFVSNNFETISPLRIQYKDYAAWQLSELNSSVFQEHNKYWLSKFKKETSILNLPSQKQRPQIKTYRGKRLGTRISPEMVKKMRNFTTEKGGSLFFGLLSVWKVLLYRYTGELDITIGSPVEGRNHADLENQIGFYINALALRNQINPEDSYLSFYEQIKINTIEAYKHKMYPFDELIENLEIQRDIGRNPLFDILVDYNGAGERGIKFKNNEEILELGIAKVKFDIELDFTEIEGGLDFLLGYNTEVYEYEMIEKLLMNYKRLLETLMAEPSACIGTVNFLSEEEETRLLFEFNKPSIENKLESNMIDLFALQAKKTPNATAIIFEGNSLTYKELDEKSNQLAHYLHKLGVNRDTLIPICIDRSFDMFIGILGIIKSGGAYVPIDTEIPDQRLEFIIEDTKCEYLLSHSSMNMIFDEFKDEVNVLYIDLLKDDLATFSNSPLNINIELDQLIYVIYTSGTTGLPKGVLIEHKSVSDYIGHQSKYFNITREDVFVLFSSISFDASIEQLFLSILNGCQLVVPKKSDLLNSELFYTMLCDYKVTHLHAVPSFLQTIEYHPSLNLKRVVSAGEPFDKRIFKNWPENISIYNKYGPTEGTISVTEYKVTKDSYDILSIGKNIGNNTCYILGDKNTLQPQGVIGEICIGGSGLARGYLNRPELMEKHFINNPFIRGESLYKTGDLGSWRPDGSIAFHGRNDNQVKIRGYRIEVEEISSIINELHNIKESVVAAVMNQNGLKELVAYIVSNELVDSNSIREGLMLLLEEKLPNYMIPHVYIKLEKLPLTPNGKIDRKSLPIPETFYTKKEYVAPTKYLEIQLVKIWEEVLNIDRIGIHDNFFELGGNSLNAIKINFRIKKILGIDLEIKSLFLFRTIKELVSQIEFSENQRKIKLKGQLLKKITL